MQTYQNEIELENLVSIDSLKIRIPFSRVEILDTNLGANFIVFNEKTSEVSEEESFKKNSLKHSVKGVTTYYGLERQVNAMGIVSEYLVILFNSKLVYDRYFEGITNGNIGLIYDRLISMSIVSFDYDTFLSGECTDVDYKKDIECKQYRKAISLIEQNAKAHKKINKGCNHFNAIGNVGIEFGKRITATESYPFVKIYHKGIELGGNKSLAFYMEYLSNLGVDMDNLIRIEATIKNRKHFKKFGITDTRLSSLLKTPQSKMSEIISKSLKVHLEPRVNTFIQNDNLSPTEQYELNLMSVVMHSGYSFDYIVSNCIKTLPEAYQRTRILDRARELYSNHLKGNKSDVITKEIDTFFKGIGWE